MFFSQNDITTNDGNNSCLKKVLGSDASIIWLQGESMFIIENKGLADYINYYDDNLASKDKI
jgi:hypothetical protein